MSCTLKDVIEFYRGDSCDLQFTVNYESGTPVDLTDFRVRFVVTGTTIDKTSDVPAEISIEDAIAGRLTVHLKPEDTQDLVKKYRYQYNAQLEDVPAVDVYTFSNGILKVI